MPTKPARPSRIIYADGREGRILWNGGPTRTDGETDTPHGDIRIKKGLDEREQAIVLLHEVLHQVFWVLGLENPQEEQIVMVGECGLTALWKNNKELFAWLHSRLSR